MPFKVDAKTCIHIYFFFASPEYVLLAKVNLQLGLKLGIPHLYFDAYRWRGVSEVLEEAHQDSVSSHNLVKECAVCHDKVKMSAVN